MSGRYDPPMSRDDERWFAGRAVLWTAFTLALIAAAVIAVFAFNVGTSDVKGRGDATRIHNSATNRIFAQQDFQQRYNRFKSQDVPNVKTAKDTFLLDPSSVNLTNLTGAIQFCHSEAGNYNTDAKSFLLKDFRDNGLPKNLDGKKCDVDMAKLKQQVQFGQ
jgi:hypothetical protein